MRRYPGPQLVRALIAPAVVLGSLMFAAQALAYSAYGYKVSLHGDGTYTADEHRTNPNGRNQVRHLEANYTFNSQFPTVWVPAARGAGKATCVESIACVNYAFTSSTDFSGTVSGNGTRGSAPWRCTATLGRPPDDTSPLPLVINTLGRGYAAITGPLVVVQAGDPHWNGTLSFEKVCNGHASIQGGAPGTNTNVRSHGSCGGFKAPQGNGAKRLCVVPRIVGLFTEQAVRKLKAAGCRRGHVTLRYVPGKRPGTVISQSPRPGKKLPHGAHVAIVVGQVALP